MGWGRERSGHPRRVKIGLTHPCHTASGLLQDHTRLWLGCQAQVVTPTKPLKKGPNGTSTREGILPPWGKGFLGWQQNIVWNSTKSVTFH